MREDFKSTFGIDTPAAKVLYDMLMQRGAKREIKSVYYLVKTFQTHLRALSDLKFLRSYYMAVCHERFVVRAKQYVPSYIRPELETYLLNVLFALYRNFDASPRTMLLQPDFEQLRKRP